MPLHIPKDTEIETFSGLYVNLADPDPATILLEDIAHALSQICRFNGHVSHFDSVAEHAVLVSKRLEQKGYHPAVQLGGLHHDDPEYALGDVVRPLKHLLGPEYERMTRLMEVAIETALGLPPLTEEDHRAIKDADNWAIFVEARHLLQSKGQGWRTGRKAWDLESGVPSRIITPNYYKAGIKPRQAELDYLKHHSMLVTKLER